VVQWAKHRRVTSCSNNRVWVCNKGRMAGLCKGKVALEEGDLRIPISRCQPSIRCAFRTPSFLLNCNVVSHKIHPTPKLEISRCISKADFNEIKLFLGSILSKYYLHCVKVLQI